MYHHTLRWEGPHGGSAFWLVRNALWAFVFPWFSQNEQLTDAIMFRSISIYGATRSRQFLFFFFHCPCKFAHLVVCFWLGELLVTALVWWLWPHKTHKRQKSPKKRSSPGPGTKTKNITIYNNITIHGGIICFWLIAEFFWCLKKADRWIAGNPGESLETPWWRPNSTVLR